MTVALGGQRYNRRCLLCADVARAPHQASLRTTAGYCRHPAGVYLPREVCGTEGLRQSVQARARLLNGCVCRAAHIIGSGALGYGPMVRFRCRCDATVKCALTCGTSVVGWSLQARSTAMCVCVHIFCPCCNSALSDRVYRRSWPAAQQMGVHSRRGVPVPPCSGQLLDGPLNHSSVFTKYNDAAAT